MKTEETIFQEIYGNYYSLLTHIINNGPLSESELLELIKNKCFGESDILLLDKIENYGFLENEDGKWVSNLDNESVLPLSFLEKSWLKAILNDRRITLFIDKKELENLNNILSDTSSLYEPDEIIYFDRCKDGDNYGSEEYISRFKAISKAIDEHQTLKITYISKRNKLIVSDCLPRKLEYSPKDDKFRLIGITQTEKYGQETTCFNLANIRELEASAPENKIIFTEDYSLEYLSEPVVVQVFNKHNAVERFMIEFSTYKKESIIDKETGLCTTKIYCHKNDLVELLIKILSFGASIKVLRPDDIVEKIKARISRQLSLIRAFTSEDTHEPEKAG